MCILSLWASSAVVGPGVSVSPRSAILRSAIILPVAITIVAALAITALALFDARRPAHSRALIALALVTTIVCTIGVGVLLTGDVALVFGAPPDRGSGLILQYNAGALFIPTFAATIVCAMTIIWPRRPAQPATVARAAR